jgi:quinol monooxygenase YgiN
MTNTANTSQENPPGDANVSFVVYIPLKPEARERGRELLLRVIDAMSAEPDFVRTWVHEDMSEPDVIVNYETWACTREHFLQHHLQKDYRQAYERALPELLAGERRIVFLREIAAYPGKQD